MRVISRPDVTDFDPFLMLDAFDSRNPADYIKGFPWHPHRGIETITYLIKGDIEHSDSLGNKGSILDGCCQWMTAGSGILHQEMPKAAERMFGVQLWLNLPKKDKMVSPKYRDIRLDMIPRVLENGNQIRVISGDYRSTIGPVQGDYVKMLFLDIEMKADSDWKLTSDAEDTLFVYIMEGDVCFEKEGKEFLPSRRAVLFQEGDELYMRAGQEGLRALILAGRPLKEPVAWGGPIVMNTQEELSLAFRQIEEGTFIKSK